MTNDEWEKRMEFILAHQAQFSVNMELLGERVDRVTERVDQLAQAQIRTEQTVEQLARVQAHVIEVVSFIGDAQVRTDERLNNLMTVVERFISEGRNGGAA